VPGVSRAGALMSPPLVRPEYRGVVIYPSTPRVPMSWVSVRKSISYNRGLKTLCLVESP